MHGYVVSINSLATQTKNSGGINNDTLTDEFTVIDDSYGSDYDNENKFFFVTKRRFILTNMNCKQETEDRLVKKKTHPYLHQTRLKSQHTLRLALYIKTNNKLLPQITE